MSDIPSTLVAVIQGVFTERYEPNLLGYNLTRGIAAMARWKIKLWDRVMDVGSTMGKEII